MIVSRRLLLVICCVLTGCSNNYKITYNSEPMGAALVCDGVNYGYTPVTLSYKVNKKVMKNGIVETVPCSAIWVSGARKSYMGTFHTNKLPHGAIITIKRPLVIGDYSKDEEFALKIQEMRRLQQVRHATEGANRRKELSNLNQTIEMINNINRQQQINDMLLYQNYYNSINNY